MAEDSIEVTRTSLFGLVAPSLGWVPPLRYLLRRARILRLLHRIPRGEVVEVGCGAGALLDDLSIRGFQAVGLETSPRAFSVARALSVYGGGAQTIVDAAGSTWAASKDVVCAFDVLEHIEADSVAVAEWVSWLRPRGWLMLSVPAHSHRWGPGDEWAGHWRRYEREGFLELLQSNGLSIVHFECYGFPLANLTEWIGAKAYRRLLSERMTGISKEEASANSGVERLDAAKMFRVLNTLPGRICLRIFFQMQAIAARTNWGSGYLVLAQRP